MPMLRWLGETYEQAEAIAGAAAAFFIGFFPPVTLFFGFFMAVGQHWLLGTFAALGFVVATAVAAWVTRMVGAAVYERYPRFQPASMKYVEPALVVEILPDEDEPARFASREATLAAMNDQVRRLNETHREGVHTQTHPTQTRPIQTGPIQTHPTQTRPVALLVAGRLRKVPLLLRPVLSLWWAGHFIGGAFIGLVVSRVAIDMMQNPAGVFLIVLPLAFQIAFLFAVNLYLIMAVGVLLPSSWLCEIVWKWRFVLDLVVCVWAFLLMG